MFIEKIDGDYSVEEIFHLLQREHREDAPSADEIALIITQLLSLDALKNASSNTEAMFNRFKLNQRQKRQKALLNPLAIKAPLFDPDSILNRLLPYTRPLFTRGAIMIWLLVVGYACLLALANFSMLSAHMHNDILAPENLAAMALLFIGIKAVHEFCHAFAVKNWGGEVHEMGITLLVLMPIPYVDASASASFRDKKKRILVAAAGIAAELFIAALALLVWLSIEPGTLRDMAFNTMLIASVSTLLFNANPLLRFDGYYILQDFAEIPNLYSRASKYYLYLIQKYGFGLRNETSPVTANGEHRWFLIYGALAFLYRFVILFAIVMFLAEEFLIVGIVLGCWAVFMQLVLPLIRAMRYVATSPKIAPVRSRALRTTTGFIAGAACALFLVPIPLTSESQGVLWVAKQAEIYSVSEGFIAEVLIQPGQRVEAGSPIFLLKNPDLAAARKVAGARKSELAIEAAGEFTENWIKSQIIGHQVDTVAAELAILDERYAGMVIRSPVDGRFVPAQPHAMKGRFLRQGELVGYIVSPESLVVKAVVSQSDIGLLSAEQQAKVRFAERVGNTVNATYARQLPSGNRQLPSAALGAAGGGNIAVLGSDSSGLTAAEKVFEVEIGLPADLPSLAGIGERAYVRFYHGNEPLGLRWWRKGRQLLLSRLNA
ncbi:MAG: HlyD family efflux transporter periplasmic adaptor subunit [Pseudomonadales bacterium]|nr:HlyD family efflux transporter periplasmic adaptor subunit [Pseudomonadales bacterium]NNL11483.1 HlyD family efflux transporter periplasmic adaptor subunit [Pseudomonadales bacterium]